MALDIGEAKSPGGLREPGGQIRGKTRRLAGGFLVGLIRQVAHKSRFQIERRTIAPQAVPAGVVDVFMAVDVPLARAGGASWPESMRECA